MAGCNCDAGLSNTGQPSCVPIQSVTSSLIMVPLKDSLGVRNGIDLSTTLPVWEDLINELDESKRYFPLPQFENVELPKADSLFEEANSGKMAFLRQGKRSFMGELWGEDSTPTLLGKLQAGRCVAFGIYIVDVNGNLVGSKENGFLYPIPVDEQSWNPVFNFATDSTVQKIMLGFDFNRLFDESTMYMITGAEAGVDFNGLSGLIDVNLTEVSQVTLTTLVFKAFFDYGTAINPIIFSGALATDFALLNTDTGTALPISASNEAPDGTYTISQVVPNEFTSGENYELSVNKNGFIGKMSFLAL